MAKNVEFKNYNDYLDDLIKSLSNFCSKSPLKPMINVVKELGKIYIQFNNNTIELEVDMNKSKKDVIKYVKENLEEYYPKIYEKIERTPNADEVQELMNNGLTLTEALNKIIVNYKCKFLIKRIHDYYNEMDLYDYKEKAVYKYKCKIPVTFILEDIKNNGKKADVISNISLLYKIEAK